MQEHLNINNKLKNPIHNSINRVQLKIHRIEIEGLHFVCFGKHFDVYRLLVSYEEKRK